MTATRSSNGAARVAVLYENDAWLSEFFEALALRNIPFEPVRVDDAAVLLDDPPSWPLIFNRVSPSSYIRGHGPAITYARALLDVLVARGRRVINGPLAFTMETSKLDQLLLFRRLGVRAPRTALFNNTGRIAEVAAGFPFPAILKPDCGGSGAYIRRVADRDELAALLAGAPDLFGPDHLLLLQEAVAGAGHAVVRTEFVDGELVYAMRARPFNTFNLCPAESCEREAADPASGEAPRVEFTADPGIAPDAVAQAREIVRGAGLDVGGAEFIEGPDGTRWYIDINATSVYRPEICAAFGVDAQAKLVDFVDRELRKEIVKLQGAAARSVIPV